MRSLLTARTVQGACRSGLRSRCGFSAGHTVSPLPPEVPQGTDTAVTKARDPTPTSASPAAISALDRVQVRVRTRSKGGCEVTRRGGGAWSPYRPGTLSTETILVIGATGAVGGQVAQELLRRRVPFKAASSRTRHYGGAGSVLDSLSRRERDWLGDPCRSSRSRRQRLRRH